MATFLLLKFHSNMRESAATNLGLANVPIRVLYVVYQNQSLLPRTSTFKIIIKMVVSCDMKVMKELLKLQQSSTFEKMSMWHCRLTFALLTAQRQPESGIPVPPLSLGESRYTDNQENLFTFKMRLNFKYSVYFKLLECFTFFCTLPVPPFLPDTYFISL